MGTNSLEFALFALSEARAGMEQQRDVLKHFRTQSLVLAGISAVLANFLAKAGGHFLGETETTVLLCITRSGDTSVLVACLLFLLSIFTCLYILVPRKDWGFHVSVKVILDDIIKITGGNERRAMLQTAVALDQLHETNASHLDRLNIALYFAIICTLGHSIAWMV